MKKSILNRVLFRGALCLLASMGAASAYITGGGVYYPTNYDSFLPPGVGGTYNDPIFSTTVKRVSNAGASGFITDEYSTINPFNADNSKFLLIHQSYFALYDGTGAFIRNLPSDVHASSEPRWSRQDPNIFYFVNGNQLKRYDVASGSITVLRSFTQYSSISGMGESDICFDGDHLVLAGDRRHVFVYQISTNAAGPSFDTGGRGFDSIYITPNDNVTITWLQGGASRYNGIEVFDRNMNFLRQLTRVGGHMDVTRDGTGEEVLIWTNSADPQPICNNGVVKVRISDAQQTCLATFDWSLAVNISAPDAGGWAFVNTYAPSNPTPSNGWATYTNEILQVRLDGGEVRRLAHHRSRPYNSYNWTPRASTSRDGSRFVYNSNYNLQAISGYGSEYSDVYLVLLGDSAPAPSPAPTPTPTPTPPPPSTSTVTRYEQDNPAIRYSGTWFPNTNGAHSGGSASLSTDRGSLATFSFTGTSVKWIGYRDEWAGLARVYLDGVLKATIDTYASPPQAQAVLYSAEGLTQAAHNLVIEVAGRRNSRSGGRWVWLDALEVVTGTGTTSTTTTTSPPPPPPPTSTGTTTRIEQNTQVVYSGGTWYTNTTAAHSGGSAVLAMDPGARATLTFTGTAVKWIAYRDEWAGIARVYLDGVLKGEFDTYASPSQAQAVMYSIGGLPNATHTIVIEVTGKHNPSSGGDWVWLDAFDVTN